MKVRCLSKNRNNKGVIVSYNLQDETGRQFQATGQQIKEEIMKGQFQFVNLQIDKAGRLVDKAEEKTEAKRDITENEISKAITELGNLMLQGKNIQCRTKYDTEDKNCIIKFNVKVNPVLISFLQRSRGKGEEYIKQQLVKNFNRNLYTINGLNAMNFSKEKLHYDLSKEEQSNGIIYHCYYYTPENLKDIENGALFMKCNYMDYDFQRVGTKIKFVSQENGKPNPNGKYTLLAIGKYNDEEGSHQMYKVLNNENGKKTWQDVWFTSIDNEFTNVAIKMSKPVFPKNIKVIDINDIIEKETKIYNAWVDFLEKELDNGGFGYEYETRYLSVSDWRKAEELKAKTIKSLEMIESNTTFDELLDNVIDRVTEGIYYGRIGDDSCLTEYSRDKEKIEQFLKNQRADLKEAEWTDEQIDTLIETNIYK